MLELCVLYASRPCQPNPLSLIQHLNIELCLSTQKKFLRLIERNYIGILFVATLFALVICNVFYINIVSVVQIK